MLKTFALPKGARIKIIFGEAKTRGILYKNISLLVGPIVVPISSLILSFKIQNETPKRISVQLETKQDCLSWYAPPRHQRHQTLRLDATKFASEMASTDSIWYWHLLADLLNIQTVFLIKSCNKNTKKKIRLTAFIMWQSLHMWEHLEMFMVVLYHTSITPITIELCLHLTHLTKMETTSFTFLLCSFERPDDRPLGHSLPDGFFRHCVTLDVTDLNLKRLQRRDPVSTFYLVLC